MKSSTDEIIKIIASDYLLDVKSVETLTTVAELYEVKNVQGKIPCVMINRDKAN